MSGESERNDVRKQSRAAIARCPRFNSTQDGNRTRPTAVDHRRHIAETIDTGSIGLITAVAPCRRQQRLTCDHGRFRDGRQYERAGAGGVDSSESDPTALLEQSQILEAGDDLVDGVFGVFGLFPAGDDEFARAKEQGDDFGFIEAVDEPRELLGFVLDVL